MLTFFMIPPIVMCWLESDALRPLPGGIPKLRQPLVVPAFRSRPQVDLDGFGAAF